MTGPRKKKTGQKVKDIGEEAYKLLTVGAVGHPNAIPMKVLRSMLQVIFSERDSGIVHERTVRDGIAWVTIHKQYPITSATRPPWGYYLMRPEERGDLKRAMITRIAALARRMRSVDRLAADRIMAELARTAGKEFQAELFA